MRSLTKGMLFFVFVGMLVVPNAQAASEYRVIRWLASPTGVAAVGLTYALTTAISNFLWAYDWTRAGASEKTKAVIQEAGGLSASIEAFVFGFFLPFWAYQYLQNIAPPVVTHPSNEFDGATSGEESSVIV